MELTDAIIVPVVLGVTEVFKRVGIPNQYAGLVSLVVGLGVAFWLSGFTAGAAIQGAFYGLSAAGLWSGSKALLN